MQPKRVLIISEYIAPVQHIAAIRWTKYAKYLAKDYGCDVTVLTNEKCFDGASNTKKQYKFDPLLDEDSKWFKTVLIPLTLSQRISNFAFSLGYKALGNMRHTNEASIEVSNDRGGASERALNRIIHLINRHKLPEKVFKLVDASCGSSLARSGKRCKVDYSTFDVVISSYGPSWPHLIAQQVKREYPHLIWIADFRDSIVVSEKTDTAANRKLAGVLSEGCDLITAVSQGTIDCLHLDGTTPAFSLNNGFDACETLTVQHDVQDRFRLVYTGTIYNDYDNRQDLTPVFAALEQLASSGAIDRGDIVVEYAGPSSHLFRGFAESFPNIPTKDHGLLPRDEVASVQRTAAVFLVAACNTRLRQGVLTGKVFEYMSRSAPILALVCGDVPSSDLKKLIEDTRTGLCFEETGREQQQAALRDFILKSYSQWKRLGYVSRDKESSRLVNCYSYRELTKRLVGIIEATLSRHYSHEAEANPN